MNVNLELDKTNATQLNARVNDILQRRIRASDARNSRKIVNKDRRFRNLVVVHENKCLLGIWSRDHDKYPPIQINNLDGNDGDINYRILC